MRLALRMRVSMSAIGSVIIIEVPSSKFQVQSRSRLCTFVFVLLPACFLDAGNETVAGHIAEADAADTELAVHGAGPAANAAAKADANSIARPQLRFVRLPPRLGQ